VVFGEHIINNIKGERLLRRISLFLCFFVFLFRFCTGFGIFSLMFLYFVDFVRDCMALVAVSEEMKEIF
jgi:hypothetical protein